MTNQQAKTVGVLGGMGPEATIDFMSRVLEHTDAKGDQDHLHLIVDQNPHVPSRQDALLGNGEDPGADIAEMARRLETAGADFLVMPCNTAHAWQQAICDAVDIPFISIVDATMAACDGRTPIGLLATDGSLAAGVYDSDEALLPDEENQAKLMEIIYSVKKGGPTAALREAIREIASALINQGAQAIVGACTEIPLVLRDGDLPVPVVESTNELARATVRLAQAS